MEIFIEFFFNKIDENDGQFIIEFNAEDWAAEKLLKQVAKQIDVFEAQLIINS